MLRGPWYLYQLELKQMSRGIRNQEVKSIVWDGNLTVEKLDMYLKDIMDSRNKS